ncbi:hypothetical protein A3A35_02945 [Candidatus Kaiserbacteria bacterium RIFCSPLOWO2_01_FULL_51_21]|uniref:Type IV secretion system coupling protein TraD DNA-binding domain-containing protein n=1 Tax=Candidatus Kaiserbacteria bacterium RIFCSPLOWO2_01_FULL_51_21 TaxID=1798508 RepID=A0A1F6EF84_9BACT|nr:MAG: hypothetical protein A3A35_02945 [Candidatus Kaiserbacteria bacterium RIFCSPLOWO2_01_FULL_51_21]
MNSGARDDERKITYFGATHTRGKREMFGIRAIDRGKHIYVIGKTGMGKSTMLENMAIQDIQNGEGIAFIDPHGATAEKLLDFVPHDRIKDVLYLAPFDMDYPIGFNVMEDIGYDKRHLVVSGLMGAFKRIWVDAWSARMEYILQNTLLALLEYPDATLLDVNRMLTNKTFRAAVVEKITDPIVRAFWVEEFASFTDTYTREATPAIQNKVGQFTANPLIRNIVGQAKSSFDLRKMMDEKKIFIVNLSKGRMGETNAALLGSMLVVKIYLAAMSRADEPAARMATLPNFYFYVDEFQSMMNEAFADILSESRKYKLALTLANQYIEQMEEKVRDAVFGNVGTLVCFRVGPFDAEVLKVVFEPTFMAEDLVGLGVGQIYLTLMIDGVGSPPFSAETLPPIEKPPVSYRDDVIRNSRERYSRSRPEMETMIAKRQKDFAPPPKAPRGREEEPRRSGGGGDRARGSGVNMRPFQGNRPRDFAGSSNVPSTREREQVPAGGDRNALRAAIQAASPPPASAGPARSPADILRERLARKAGGDNQIVRESVQRVQAPTPEPQPAAVRPHFDEPKEENSGEVSHEELQKILKGEL